jgi:hypothetical protein
MLRIPGDRSILELFHFLNCSILYTRAARRVFVNNAAVPHKFGAPDFFTLWLFYSCTRVRSAVGATDVSPARKRWVRVSKIPKRHRCDTSLFCAL